MELGHKVSFDYLNRLITVSPGVTNLDVKTDLYSDMKEWMILPNRKNRAFKPPIRAIGGDATTSGEKAGDIYFTQNGWRVVIDIENVQVTGVLFSDDFDTPWISNSTRLPIYPMRVSSLVNAIDPSAIVVSGGSNSSASAGEIADAVWNKAIADLLTAGSTGERMQKLLTLNQFLGLD